MHRLVIILLICLVLAFCIHTFTSINSDIGLHLTLGKLIIENHTIPDTNYFSYTNPDYPFINHHWFGEVLLYVFSLIAGLKGLIIIKAIIITSTFTFSFFASYRREAQLPSFILGLSSILILIERTDVRPEMFSFLFLGWFLFVLYRKSDTHLLWSLPLAQLLWINTHIYFFLGPLVVFYFLIGKYAEIKKLPDRRFLIFGLTIVLINIINPAGLQGALYPLNIFHNYGYTISENVSPFRLASLGFPAFTLYALIIGILLAGFTFVRNRKNIHRNIFGLLLYITSAVLALVMIRNMPIFALIMLPIGIKNVAESNWQLPRLKYLLLSMTIAFTILFSLVVSDRFYRITHLPRHFGLTVPTYGNDAVAFVKQNHLQGKMLNNFDIGSFLIWRMPEHPVFIDARPEAYPASFIHDIYVAMQENPVVFEKYADLFGINFIFWNGTDGTISSQQFIKNLSQNPKWAMVYRDSIFFIAVRNTKGNQGFITNLENNL